MNIYVLTLFHLDVDSGECEYTVIGTYQDAKSAKAKMAAMVKETKERYSHCKTEWQEVKDHGRYENWSIWEKGEYMSHHSTVQITKEVAR